MKAIAWRPYDPKDEDALWALHHQLERKFHRRLDFPQPDHPSIIATLVGERDGVITNGITAEVEAEICHIGVNPLRRQEAQQAAEILIPVLRSQQIRIVRSFVPEAALVGNGRRMPALERILKAAQMHRETSDLTSWFRWIVEEAA